MTDVSDAATAHEREGVEAVVYDLDGTLVSLAVDWEQVRRETNALVAEAGAETADIEGWDVLDRAAEVGVRDEVDALISRHERDGARTSTRLALADVLLDVPHPVGVCSLNCEAACRLALEAHDLAAHVDVVVGRDSVSTRKPHPAPLLAVLERLSVDPSSAVFVGDSESDGVTAERAGTAFALV